MGYGDEQLRELEATINATDCDAVITGTPMNLAEVDRHQASSEARDLRLADDGQPTLADALAPFVETHRRHLFAPVGVDA